MAWYNTNWLFRKKVTIPNLTTFNGMTTSNLTNFPVYVNLANMGADFFSNVRTDGGDIRVTLSDEVTEVPRDLVSINTSTQTGEFYFRANTLNGNATTDFYIYFGNANATNPAKNATFGTYNVWNSVYRLVLHMDEFSPAGSIQAGTSFINSANNTYLPYMLGTPAVTFLANGPLGKSLDIDGVNYYMSMNDPVDMTEYTFSTYVKPTAPTGALIVKNLGTNNSSTSFSENLRISGSTFQHYYFDGSAVTLNSNLGALNSNNYYHLAGTAKNGGTGYLYQQGLIATATDPTGTLWTGGDTFNMFGRDGSSPNWFAGLIEEFRISPIQLSYDWITTESNNIRFNNFFTVGTLETGPSPNLQSLSPAIGSTGNAANTNLVLDFDQNVTVGTGNVTIEQIPNLNIGGTFQGDLAELMMLNTLTDSDRQKIEGYLAWKWFGGNNNLPSNHPYKLYAPRN
jgi:hypothetical protein